MAHTLGEAAKAAGVSKTTLRRAIQSGRISAIRRDDGSYEIDPAELHRAFPSHSDGSGTLARSVTAIEPASYGSKSRCWASVWSKRMTSSAISVGASTSPRWSGARRRSG
jgi:excisionase family DNA binding protein